MKFREGTIMCLAACISLSQGAVVPIEIGKRIIAITTESPDPLCTNGPTSRACWTDGYSIATDFDKKFPTTGNTASYKLTLTNGTCDPDGHGSRICLLINGKYIGPVIRAAWGDTLSITVENQLEDNGTSIHWHGVRQYHSPGSDGVNGVTECPLAPSDSSTYTFQVTQFGTSWYHSHFSSQYGDGILGPMVFEGPASGNYDIDLGPYILNEWYYQTAYQINAITDQNLQYQLPPPSASNILINGTNKNANGGGQYDQVTLVYGTKYRLRLINAALDNFIRVSLDSHVMQVMTSDFIPLNPFYTQTLVMAAGQRYDVVIFANQSAGNYWFRANVARDCASGNDGAGRAIWTYRNATAGTPNSTGYNEPSDCAEPTPLSPFWVQPVPSGSFQNSLQTLDVGITKQIIVPGGDAIFVWSLHQTSLIVDWANPTMSYLMDGNFSYPTNFNALPTVNEGGWNYWLIQQPAGLPPLPHPIHLHGHDFFVLGQGSGTFNATTALLNYATPARRDTSSVPAGGWLVVAFNSNNPGTWLMHCHIAWHASEGLAVQFVEAPSQMTFPDKGQFDTTCANWRAYESEAYYQQDDSGV